MSNFTVFQNTQFEELIEAIKKGGGGGSYTLPPATAETLGGIKVGDNLTVEEDGTLNAEPPTLPIASTTSLGGIKVGNGLSISSDGTLSATGGGGGGSSLVFSSEETEVGTWIDGKTLYQKSFQFQTPTTYSNAVISFNLGLFDLDTFMIDTSHSFLVGKKVSAVNRNPNINLRSGNTFAESLILTSCLGKIINPNASNYNEITFNTRIDNSGNYLNCTIYLTIQYTKSN